MSIEVSARCTIGGAWLDMFSWERVRRFWRDREGASAAEYALILTLVGAGLATALLALTSGMSTAVNSTSGTMPFPGL